jgi:hypothetical protein
MIQIAVLLIYHEVPNPNITIRNFFIAVGWRGRAGAGRAHGGARHGPQGEAHAGGDAAAGAAPHLRRLRRQRERHAGPHRGEGVDGFAFARTLLHRCIDVSWASLVREHPRWPSKVRRTTCVVN